MGRAPRDRDIFILCLRDLPDFYKCKFNKQTLVRTFTIVDITLIHNFQGLI